MNLFAAETGYLVPSTLALLMTLLPGFIAGSAFYSLTAYLKPSAFERIVQALIFAVIVQLVIGPLGLIFRTTETGLWPNMDGQAIVSGLFVIDATSWASPMPDLARIAAGFLLGISLAGTINRDLFHRFMRRIGITGENSFPSELHSAFARIPAYVTLHLDGERRLMGFPEEWPSDPGTGYFLLQDPAWINDENEAESIEEVDCIMIPMSEVNMVEFSRPATTKGE